MFAMNSIREILRLHHECGRSQREVARSCGLSAGAVNKVLRLAGQAGLSWPLLLNPGVFRRQIFRLFWQQEGEFFRIVCDV